MRVRSSFFSSPRLLPLLLASLFLAGFFSFSNPVQAQGEPSVPYCPVVGDIIVEFENPAENGQLEDRFMQNVLVENSSEYTLPGAQIGLFIFTADNPRIPAYWLLVDESFLLTPADERVVPIDADLSVLPAGEYEVAVVAHQGAPYELLGSVVKNYEGVDRFSFTKTSEQSQAVAVDVELNGVTSPDQVVAVDRSEVLDVAVVTANESDAVVPPSQMHVIVTQGEAPLGTTIRKTKADSVYLVPGRTRTTEVVDRFLEPGTYTVYAALATPNTFQPIESVPASIDGETGIGEETYLTRLALSEHPLSAETEIVACFDQVERIADYQLPISHPFGMAVAITNPQGEVFREQQDNQSRAFRHLSFSPGQTVASGTLSVTLLEQRFSSPASQDPAITTPVEDRPLQISPVLSFTSSIACEDPAACAAAETAAAEVEKQSNAASLSLQDFWFYLGITLAAALLLYIMLRRLHPEDHHRPDVNKHELQ